MQRLEVEFRPSATDDLLGIFKYILKKSGNADIALAFTRRIQGRCQRIGNAPQGDRSRDDLSPGLRTVPFERTAIIGCVVENQTV